MFPGSVSLVGQNDAKRAFLQKSVFGPLKSHPKASVNGANDYCVPWTPGFTVQEQHYETWNEQVQSTTMCVHHTH